MSFDETIRAFLAVPIVSEVAETLNRVATSLRSQAGSKLRVVPAANIHVTLVFLGNISGTQVGLLRERLNARALPNPARLRIARLALLPGPRRPSVLTAEPDPDRQAAIDTVREIYEVAASAATSIGVEPDRRPFRPHATIGRFKRGFRPKQSFLTALENGLSDPVEIDVSRMILYKSTLNSDGATYDPIDEWELGDRGNSV